MRDSDTPTIPVPYDKQVPLTDNDLTEAVEPIFDDEQTAELVLEGPQIGFAEPDQLSIRPCPSPFRHPIRATGWLIQTVVGVVSLVLLLAVVAAIPVVNFWALGYLLEVEARVARTGRWKMMYHLLDRAPRMGTIVLGIFLWLLPLRLLSSLTADAKLIDPTSANAQTLDGITFFAALAVGLHLCLALARGGSVGCFLRPIKNIRWLFSQLRNGWDSSRAAAAVKNFVSGFRVRYHFWLGLRGFAIAIIWLLIPTSLFAVAKTGEQISGPAEFLGGVMMLPVLCWLPFLQARFAAENRFRAGFEVGHVRRMFSQAPIYWFLALFTLYLLTLPLYLFKIIALPRDVVWFATTVFLVSLYPARVFVGWAYHRALVSTKQRGWFIRWGVRGLILVTVASYTFMLFFTQAVGARGRDVLFEQPAFLLPTPF